MTSKISGPPAATEPFRRQRQQVRCDEGGSGYRSTAIAHQTGVPIGSATDRWPIRCRAAAIRPVPQPAIKDPRMPGCQHVDESGLPLQIGSLGELPGEPVHIEVPAFAGDRLLPAGTAADRGVAAWSWAHDGTQASTGPRRTAIGIPEHRETDVRLVRAGSSTCSPLPHVGRPATMVTRHATMTGLLCRFVPICLTRVANRSCSVRAGICHRERPHAPAQED